MGKVPTNEQIKQMQKHPNDRWQAAKSTEWFDSNGKVVASAAPVAACGYAVWVWNGTGWGLESDNCTGDCKPLAPAIDGSTMEVGMKVSKACAVLANA